MRTVANFTGKIQLPRIDSVYSEDLCHNFCIRSSDLRCHFGQTELSTQCINGLAYRIIRVVMERDCKPPYTVLLFICEETIETSIR